MMRTASSCSRSAGENKSPNTVVHPIITIVAMPIRRVACVPVPAEREVVGCGAREAGLLMLGSRSFFDQGSERQSPADTESDGEHGEQADPWPALRERRPIGAER